MHQSDLYGLSENHPLRTDPERPWPYKVLVGYRAPGNRKILGTRSVYVRAAGEDKARMVALQEARKMMPMVLDGQRLKCSRIVSSRPLDKQDAIDLGGK